MGENKHFAQIVIQIREDQEKRVKEEKEKSGRSPSEIIQEALDQYFR